MTAMNRGLLAGWLTALVLSGVGGASAAPAVPERPDVRAIAALIERPNADCNAATFFLQAERVYRETEAAELKKPHALRLPLPPEHPAAKLVLKGTECRRAEFPYSRDFAIPPTNQEIPMRALYWTTAIGLSEEAQRLRAAGKLDEARRTFARVTQLGLLLYEDPGITYIQDMISLNVLALGVAGLGDLALARGDKGAAEGCEAFLAASRAYLEQVGVFLRDVLPLTRLVPDPEAGRIRDAATLLGVARNPTLKIELIQYLGIARPLCTRAETRTAIEQALKRSAKEDEDARIRKVAAWALATKAEEAREIIQGYLKHPSPMP
jgi:hypothetical protein